METVRQPGCRVDVEVPADRIGAVLLQCIKRIYGVALGLTHLLAVLILYVSQYDNVLIARAVKEQRGLCQQGVEPSAGLVYCLGDELCRILCFKQFLVLKRIVMLCIRHCAGVEPAVDHFRYTVHGLAALRAGEGHFVDVRTVQFHLCRIRISGEIRQFLTGSYGMQLAAFAFPDVERGTPVTVTGDCPILQVLQPVTETSLADGFRDPVDLVVVADHVFLHRGHLDVPALTRVVQKRCITSPAVRIAVFKFRCRKEQLSCRQVLEYFRIGTDHALSQFLCVGLAAHTSKRGALLQYTLFVYHLYERQVILAAYVRIVFTEGRSDMYHAGTIGHRNVFVTYYIEALLVLTVRIGLCTFIQRLVLLVLQIRTFVSLQHLVSRLAGFLIFLGQQLGQHGIQQCLCHIVGIAVAGFYLTVGLCRMYAECHVARQGPGCGGPGQDESVFVLTLEAHDRGTFLHILIALCHFLCGKRSPAARAVRHDLEALVQQAFVPDLLECPPFGLDEVVIVGNIGIVHISPETNGTGEILPHSLIFPYRFLTFLDERLQTVSFDLILAVQAQQFFHFDLDRQSVGIPAGLTRYHISLHGTITRDHILDHTGQHMANVRLAVCRRRSVIEHIGRAALPLLDTLPEDIFVFPEFFDLFFTRNKILVFGYFLIHLASSFFNVKKLTPVTG